MPGTDEAKERLLDRARADRHVVAVLLYGSAARGEPARDADLAVVLVPGCPVHPQEKAIEYAGHSSGRRHEGLDVTVFQALPLYIRQRVLAEGRPIWVRDEDALYEVAFATIREWEDFRPHYEEYLEAVASGPPPGQPSAAAN